MIEDKKSTAQRFAAMWRESRYAAGVSQEQMALELGVNKKTIQNWEKGISSPSMFQGFEWFRVLGINPLRYYLAFIYPEFEKPADDTQIQQALITYIQNCTPAEREQLLFLVAGQHGSDWYGLLQMLTAHCHTSMKSRVVAANTVLENYCIEQAQGNLVCDEAAAPDVSLLRCCVDNGRNAASAGQAGYTATAITHNEKQPPDKAAKI